MYREGRPSSVLLLAFGQREGVEATCAAKSTPPQPSPWPSAKGRERKRLVPRGAPLFSPRLGLWPKGGRGSALCREEHPSPALPLAFGQREGVEAAWPAESSPWLAARGKGEAVVWRMAQMRLLPFTEGEGEGWGGVLSACVPDLAQGSHISNADLGGTLLAGATALKPHARCRARLGAAGPGCALGCSPEVRLCARPRPDGGRRPGRGPAAGARPAPASQRAAGRFPRAGRRPSLPAAAHRGAAGGRRPR